MMNIDDSGNVMDFDSSKFEEKKRIIGKITKKEKARIKDSQKDQIIKELDNAIFESVLLKDDYKKEKQSRKGENYDLTDYLSENYPEEVANYIKKHASDPEKKEAVKNLAVGDFNFKKNYDFEMGLSDAKTRFFSTDPLFLKFFTTSNLNVGKELFFNTKTGNFELFVNNGQIKKEEIFQLYIEKTANEDLIYDFSSVEVVTFPFSELTVTKRTIFDGNINTWWYSLSQSPEIFTRNRVDKEIRNIAFFTLNGKVYVGVVAESFTFVKKIEEDFEKAKDLLSSLSLNEENIDQILKNHVIKTFLVDKSEKNWGYRIKEFGDEWVSIVKESKKKNKLVKTQYRYLKEDENAYWDSIVRIPKEADKNKHVLKFKAQASSVSQTDFLFSKPVTINLILKCKVDTRCFSQRITEGFDTDAFERYSPIWSLKNISEFPLFAFFKTIKKEGYNDPLILSMKKIQNIAIVYKTEADYMGIIYESIKKMLKKMNEYTPNKGFKYIKSLYKTWIKSKVYINLVTSNLITQKAISKLSEAFETINAGIKEFLDSFDFYKYETLVEYLLTNETNTNAKKMEEVLNEIHVITKQYFRELCNVEPVSHYNELKEYLTNVRYSLFGFTEKEATTSKFQSIAKSLLENLENTRKDKLAHILVLKEKAKDLNELREMKKELYLNAGGDEALKENAIEKKLTNNEIENLSEDIALIGTIRGKIENNELNDEQVFDTLKSSISPLGRIVLSPLFSTSGKITKGKTNNGEDIQKFLRKRKR